jgi:hypothetical protein
MTRRGYRTALALLVGISICAQAAVASAYTMSIDASRQVAVGGTNISLDYSATGVDLHSCYIHWPTADLSKGSRQNLNQPSAFEQDLPDSHWWYADVAFSADGTAAAVGQYGGAIYLASKTSVNTWPWKNAGAPSLFWTGFALSGDGKKIVAASTGHTTTPVHSGAIYISNNSGDTWRENAAAGTHNWNDVAMSSDGNKIIAAADYLYVSNDGGVTWKKNVAAGAHPWKALAMTPDGSKIAASTYGSDDYIYISNNGGVSWTPRASPAWWWDVAMTPDGIHLAATASKNDFINTSDDGGITWTRRYNNAYWAGIAISNDGKTILANPSAIGPQGSDTDLPRLSRNGGVTWTRLATYDDSVRAWMGAGVSPDGKWLFAGTQTDAIYRNSSPFFDGAPPFDSAGGTLGGFYVTAPPTTWTISLVCKVGGVTHQASTVVKVSANNCYTADRAPGTDMASYQPQAFKLDSYDDIADTQLVYYPLDYANTEYVCLRNNYPDAILIPRNTIQEWNAFKAALPNLDLDVISDESCTQTYCRNI